MAMQQPMAGNPYPPAPSMAPHAEMTDAMAGTGAGPARRGRKPRKPKPEEPTDEGLPPAPGVAEGIEVKTKFPVARIKRIMQADEEVGKVAQQTPIAVGKALELFMVDLVTKSADVCKDRGQKRITGLMLKQVIETDDQWDFLREIASKVDTEEKRGRHKAETDSDEEDEPKKRGRGPGRKKKSVG